jgi:hypothetical protein
MSAFTTSEAVAGGIALSLTLGIPYAATCHTLALDGAAWETVDGRTRIVVAAVAFGLAGLAVATALVATVLARRDATHRGLWSVWSLASVAHLLGFGCYPVWLNGVMAASTRELFNELDPKRVAPFVWFKGWLDYPEGPLTLGLVAIAVFTPLVALHVVVRLAKKQWSWNLALEAALPLAWIGLHRPVLFAVTWSLD